MSGVNLNSAEGRSWPSLSIQNLNRIGRELHKDLTPAVAGMCLRLVYHAQCIGALPKNGADQLLNWAGDCYSSWLRHLEAGDANGIKETLATDPFNLVAGALCLSDAELVHSCIRGYLGFYRRARSMGVEALSERNRPLLAYLLSCIDESYATQAVEIFGPTTNPEALLPLETVDVKAKDIAAYALMKTEFGKQRAISSPISLQELCPGLTVATVWARDLPSVGLMLLASALIYGEARPPELVAWIQRVIRRDGFIGIWDLYRDSVTKANLLGTLNIYWGLHVLFAATSPLLPRLNQEEIPSGHKRSLPHGALAGDTYGKIKSQECVAAVKRMTQWIDRHTDRFRLLPACKDLEDYASRVKPLVELSMLCSILTKVEHHRANAPWYSWAKRTATKLADHLKWEGFIESFRMQPTVSLGLTAYPLLSLASSYSSPFEEEVRQLLRDPFTTSQERTPMRQMDFYYLCDLMGLTEMTPSLEKQISQTVLGKVTNPLLFIRDSLYDVTHVVFYATMFGQRDPSVLGSSLEWLRRHLVSLTLACLLGRDADVGAELMLCQMYCGLKPGEGFWQALGILLKAVPPSGGVRGPRRPEGTEGDEFDMCYHTTLVSTAAIAEAWIRGWTHSRVGPWS